MKFSNNEILMKSEEILLMKEKFREMESKLEKGEK